MELADPETVKSVIYVVASVTAIICYSNVEKLTQTIYLGRAGPTGSGRPASEFVAAKNMTHPSRNWN